MKKPIKVMIALVVSAAVVAGSYFGLRELKKRNQEKRIVDVYPVSSIAYNSNMWGSDETLTGSVSLSKEQRVYAGRESVVAEIKVEEGDTVKAGDLLLVYDTTQQKLKLESELADVELARSDWEMAKNELNKLYKVVPVEPTTEQLTTEEPTTEQPTTEAPTTEKPTTEEPSTENTATEEPSTENNSTEKSSTEKSSEESTEKNTEENSENKSEEKTEGSTEQTEENPFIEPTGEPTETPTEAPSTKARSTMRKSSRRPS